MHSTERLGWERVYRGLQWEAFAVGVALVLILLSSVDPLVQARSHPHSREPFLRRIPEFQQELEFLLFNPFLLWVIPGLIGRWLCVGAPAPAARWTALGSAIAFTILAPTLMALAHFVLSESPVLRPEGFRHLPLITGTMTAELFFVLHLRAVALRFGDTSLGHRVILYFSVTAIGLMMLDPLSTVARSSVAPQLHLGWLSRPTGTGLVWAAGIVLIGWRFLLIRRARRGIAEALLHDLGVPVK